MSRIDYLTSQGLLFCWEVHGEESKENLIGTFQVLSLVFVMVKLPLKVLFSKEMHKEQFKLQAVGDRVE